MTQGIGRRRLLIGAAATLVATPADAEATKADRLLVRKTERRIDVIRGAEVARSYPIRLGRNPVGPKIFQYDGRTPEGTYVIDGRTQNTPYHLALHISYPQADNVARAAQYRLPAGGGIFIHGTPDGGPRFQRDWTDGCIAVGNRAIEELWAMVDVGTPIEIRP